MSIYIFRDFYIEGWVNVGIYILLLCDYSVYVLFGLEIRFIQNTEATILLY